MNEVTLLVLLDAFRPDYLWRTEFLRDLARRSTVGAFEEPFGFVPRAAYFGGLTPNEFGYSNLFAREPERSPFPVLPALARVAAVVDPGELRAACVADAVGRLPDFAARYADAFQVALDQLPEYAFAEVEPPWGPRCGYRSLFHVLDDHDMRWVQCAWPYTRAVAAADPGIIGECLDQLSPEVRFAFVHLSALDAVGHTYGPGSIELQRALEDVDRACATLVTAAHERYDRVRLVVFGDHGMVTVVRHVDLAGDLGLSGLRAGVDYQVFVDSPMARFWFTSAAARARMTAWLSRRDDGRVLTDADLRRYQAERMRRGNGELFYAAHPGIVFAPSAFQARGTVMRGMHGYLPDVADNRGGFLLYDSAARLPRSAGVVKAVQLYPTCLQLCGIDPAAYTPHRPVVGAPAPARWSVGGVAAAESRVEADVRRATAVLRRHAPASAVVVTGSFGRGEGLVVPCRAAMSPVNDYDFVVAGTDAARAAGLGPDLAAQLGTDFCDVLTFTTLADLPPAQLSFDLRYGSRVVAGDRRALDRLPRYAPGEIPRRDGARLLMNRIAGVMLVPLPEQHGEVTPLSAFAVTQLTKALIAAGDAHLIGVGDYSTRLAERAARFRSLAPALGLDGPWRPLVDQAYDFRLRAGRGPAPFTASHFVAVRDAIATAIAAVAGDADPAAPEHGWDDAVSACLALAPDTVADQAWVVDRLRGAGFAPAARPDGQSSLRLAVLAGLRELFRHTASAASAPVPESVRACLARLGAPRASAVLAPSTQRDLARRHLATAWLAIYH